MTEQSAGTSISPYRPKVLLVVFDPLVLSEGGRRLSEVLGWNQVDNLIEQYINDLRAASAGYCHYQIAHRVEVDGFPEKIDGFRYSSEQYLAAWHARSGFHDPDWANYRRILSDVRVVERVADRQIDEVWLFAFPYAGFYESRMAGPGAFWCNSPPLDGYEHLERRFIVMGFNYERGVGEMLESHGHRAESIMSHVFRNKRGEANLWDRFIRYDRSHPGLAEVGNVHFAPNSQRDYDWGNKTKVLSRCDTWLNFPDLSGPARSVNCSEWGNGDTRQHHLWWFSHIPHEAGEQAGIANNWWLYITDPNAVF